MKQLVKMSLVIVFMLAGTGFVSAQYTIQGSQTKGRAGVNAKLQCKAVVINKTVKVTAVSGNNNGFWITDGRSKYNYWKPNDRSAIGLVLKPGTYYAYPNLKPNANRATVVIHLR